MSEITDLMIATGFAALAGKVLGPTADYLGDGVRQFAEKRVENLKNIFSNADAKLGERASLSGAVPPRVLAGIVQFGSYSDDSLACEYYGGVLASSRTEIPRDDRAATFVDLVSRMSSYQLRLHYIIYRNFLDLYGRSNAHVTESRVRTTLRTFIPERVAHAAMEFSEQEASGVMMEHAIIGLAREELINPIGWAYGDPSILKHSGYHGEERGLVVEPSPFGVELFLHAMGGGHAQINAFLHEGTSIAPVQGIIIQEGSHPLVALTQGAPRESDLATGQNAS